MTYVNFVPIPYDPDMTEQPYETAPRYNWMGFQIAASDERNIGPQGTNRANISPQGTKRVFAHLTDSQRLMLCWGGALLGLGTGTVLAFAIYIFEKAHPLPDVINGQGYDIKIYPNMALTILLVFAGSLAAGFGLAALGAALINTRQAEDPRANDPTSGATTEPRSG